MKVLLIAFALVLGTTSGFEYDELLQQTIEQIDNQMQMYTNTTLMNFYTYSAQSIGMQFQMFAETVAQSENPYAIDHVITYRQNYTAVQYILENMINDTRDEIIDTFTFQKDNIAGLLPMIKRTADDVQEILSYKNCDETDVTEFYTNLISITGMRVTMTLSEGYTSYIGQLMNHYVPFMLFQHMMAQLQICVNPISGDQTETIDCMVQKDDLYLSSTMNLISESLRATASLINHFNLKITDFVMKDVDRTFSKAYRDAFILQCE